MRTILRVLPALGSEKDHLHPPSGLSFKHFAVAGVICAVLLVGSLILLVMLLLAFVVAPRANQLFRQPHRSQAAATGSHCSQCSESNSWCNDSIHFA